MEMKKEQKTRQMKKKSHGLSIELELWAISASSQPAHFSSCIVSINCIILNNKLLTHTSFMFRFYFQNKLNCFQTGTIKEDLFVFLRIEYEYGVCV